MRAFLLGFVLHSPDLGAACAIVGLFGVKGNKLRP
jgi:hypothetical protein